MKKNIEQIITDNRHKFDAAQMPDGFLYRFDQKLKRPGRHNLIFGAIAVSTVAAVVALFFVLQNPVQVQMSDTEREVATLREYYQGQQQKTKEIIDKLLETAPEATQAEIRTELAMMSAQDGAFQAERDRAMRKDERYIAQELSYYRARQNNLQHIQKILSK